MTAMILSVSKSWPLLYVLQDDPEIPMQKLPKIKAQKEAPSTSKVSAFH